MASEDGRALGPGGLTPAMTQAELARALDSGLSAVPHAKGISTHMGSLLTRRQQSMRRLMRAISRRRRPLFFVDSRTTPRSVAYQVARAHRIPAIERDVFLDHQRNSLSVLEQLHRLINVARHQGTAVGIAHPYPETLDVLQAVLPGLSARGVKLVPVSQLMEQRVRAEVERASRSQAR